ncbi:uncharacterized protein BDCG_06738 [Blastomyces dermatitidis ER-3]|uniref:Uncharacterized protein n=1 Tax=Ajellomyces dermatitidis (strain ER-3 / ATCC MYA-2586) TaxID=559297 RepID=A0ABM9YIY2_AJEDR|nr:uncharacterized protein BDCG_06738 [Blastomyces dermatitidis ER-3]EEQ91618.2 hypothetical protein BDCG_06738 [Blastomyces dermatitidis ER-3]
MWRPAKPHHLPPSATIIARSIEDGRMGLPSHSRIVFKNMTQYFALKPGARELPIASRSRVPRIVDCGFPVPSPFALPSMESVLETAVVTTTLLMDAFFVSPSLSSQPAGKDDSSMMNKGD